MFDAIPNPYRALQANHTEGKRGELTERHSTEHFRIKEWVLPLTDSDFHQFHIEGPGNQGKCFLGTSEDCGVQFIQALERTYMAGFERGRFYDEP
jgi:hypothetical protein